MTTAVGSLSLRWTEAARESFTSLFSRRFSSAYVPAKLPAPGAPFVPAMSALAVSAPVVSEAVCSDADEDAVEAVDRMGVGMTSVDREGWKEGS